MGPYEIPEAPSVPSNGIANAVKPVSKLLSSLTGVGLGMDVVSSLYGIISGIGQRRQGRQLLDSALNAPKYEVPQELMQQVGLRQAQLNARNPAFQDLENDIFANQAATVFNARQAAPGSSAMLGVLGTAQASTNKALRDAAMQESLQYEQRLRGLEAAQSAVGQQREKAYLYNVFEPAQRNFQAGQELMGVGQENVYGGLRSMAGMAGNMFTSEMQNKTLSILFPDLFKNKQTGKLPPMLYPNLFKSSGMTLSSPLQGSDTSMYGDGYTG